MRISGVISERKNGMALKIEKAPNHGTMMATVINYIKDEIGQRVANIAGADEIVEYNFDSPFIVRASSNSMNFTKDRVSAWTTMKYGEKTARSLIRCEVKCRFGDIEGECEYDLRFVEKNIAKEINKHTKKFAKKLGLKISKKDK